MTSTVATKETPPGPAAPAPVARGAAGRTAKRIGLGWLMVSPPVLVVIVFVGIPVIGGIAFAVGYTGGPNSFATLLATSVLQNDGSPTLDVFKNLFKDQLFLSDLWVTIIVTAVTVVVATLLAWAIALYARLSGSRWGSILTGVAIIPLFIPVVIGAYAIRNFYMNTGFWGIAGHMVGITLPPLSYHTSGIIVGQVWTSLPFAVLLISSGLASVPDALVDAARDAGASTARAVWSIMVPMCTVPTVIVATFTGVGVLGSFTVPFMIGPTAPTMLGVQLYTTYNAYGRPQDAQAMAVVMFALAILIGWAYVWANARQAKTSAVMGG